MQVDKSSLHARAILTLTKARFCLGEWELESSLDQGDNPRLGNGDDTNIFESSLYTGITQ
jgi:hypothetical protein